MGGGSQEKYDVQEGGGGIGKADVCGQGEGGGPKSRKFCGRHLSMAPCGSVGHSTVSFKNSSGGTAMALIISTPKRAKISAFWLIWI